MVVLQIMVVLKIGKCGTSSITAGYLTAEGIYNSETMYDDLVNLNFKTNEGQCIPCINLQKCELESW